MTTNNPEGLYIPIWFYSNRTGHKCLQTLWIFTFQSGSIQMFRFPICELLHSFFTFQSGSIQMDVGGYTVEGFNHFTFQSGSIQIIFAKGFLAVKTTLHSNLVLFKSSPICLPLSSNILYIPIWFYSNIKT